MVSRAALLVALLARRSAAACTGATYSYDGAGACASCAAGAAFVSAASSCLPASAPSDTAFSLSGGAAEGVSAFGATVASPAYAAGPFGAASGALALSSGQHLSAAGASAPSFLPSGGNVAWSASAWVKCAAPVNWAGVVEWGAAGDAQGALSPQVAALVVAATTQSPVSVVVSTLAGSAGQTGTSDGQGAAARFTFPTGIAVDSSGSIYVADQSYHIIRKITSGGLVSTFAGSAGQVGSSDGQGAAARFRGPFGIAIDSSGAIYVADSENQLIRKITPGGLVSTLAGSAGQSGSADGQGASARFNNPYGVAIDSSGSVYVADSSNNLIRKITPGGLVSTFAGSVFQGGSADGQGAAARFNSPFGVAVDSSGSIYVADWFNCLIRKITSGGLVSTLAGSAGQSGFADGQGAAARFNNPQGIAVDSIGNIYVADNGNDLIRKITPWGFTSTLAGNAGQQGYTDGAPSKFYNPPGVAVDSSGTIYVADAYNRIIRKISATSIQLPACDDKWRHVALSYSPSTSPSLRGFVDGADLGIFSTAAIALPSASSSTLRVGWSGDSSTNSGSPFAGSLADLRIFNRTLAPSEVLALAQPSAGSFPGANLVQLTAPYPGATLHQFACVAGSAGAVASPILLKSAADNSWAWAAAPACTPCAAGSWAAQGSTSCAPCPAGTFGDHAGLATSACSGTCATCTAGSTRPASSSSSVSCNTADIRAVPTSFGLQIWPAAHPSNPQHVDLVIAPSAQCAQLTSAGACAAAASIVGADGVTRFVVGTAAAFHMEAGETLTCAAG